MGVELGAEVLMMTSYEAPVEYIGESPGDDPVHYGKQYRIRVSDSFDWERSWENLVAVVKRCGRIPGNGGLRLARETRAGDNDSRTIKHLEIGIGTIDWVAVFQALNKHGFDGYVAPDFGDCPDPKGACWRSRDYLESLEL